MVYGLPDLLIMLPGLFKSASSHEAEIIASLSLGQLHPPYIGTQFNIAEKNLIKAVAEFLHIPQDSIKAEVKHRGDIGLVLASHSWQGSADLSVVDVYEVLSSIEQCNGIGGRLFLSMYHHPTEHKIIVGDSDRFVEEISYDENNNGSFFRKSIGGGEKVISYKYNYDGSLMAFDFKKGYITYNIGDESYSSKTYQMWCMENDKHYCVAMAFHPILPILALLTESRKIVFHNYKNGWETKIVKLSNKIYKPEKPFINPPSEKAQNRIEFSPDGKSLIVTFDTKCKLLRTNFKLDSTE